MADEIQDLPKFSSLANCLLIDASFRSRDQVIKDIKSSNIFENIIEASSIDDGHEKIHIRSFDACLLGPSVSLDLVSSFIKKAKPRSLAKDCAFIAVIKRDLDPTELTEPHSVARVPCTKQAFFESVVRGVLKANKGTAWPGFKLGDDGSVMFLDGGQWKVLKGDTGDDSALQSIIPEDFILNGNPESIQKFCDGLQHSPPSRIEKIIKMLLSGSGGIDDPFVGYFLAAIKEWKDDQSFLSLKEASQNLRQKLLAFKNLD